MSAPAIISSGTAAGGPPVGGSGATNTIPRWTGPTTLGDSLITQTLAGAPFEATRIRVATGVDTYAWFRDSVPSGNVLFVAANAAFGAYKGLEIASAGTYFTFGNVGIGTTSPSGRLSVTDAVGSNGQSGLNVGTIAAPVRGNLWYATDGTGWKYQIGKWQSGAFTPQMTFQDDGNVGIGTTSAPNYGVGYTTLAQNGAVSSVTDHQAGGTRRATWLTTSGGTNFGTTQNIPLVFQAGASSTERARIDSDGNVIINTAAIATNATNGFLYVPSCAGTPTGTPTTYTGRVPIVVDTTNNKLYFYSGGAWRDAGP